MPELLQLPDPYPFYHNASVAGNPALEPAQQPQALRRALTLLQPLKAPRTQLSLGGLTMSEALACELAGEAAAGWHHLCLGRIEWPADVVLTTRLPLVTLLHLSKTTVLTDELQLSMLRSVSYASSLRVRRLSDIQLQRQFPKGIQRRWGAIEIEGTVELASWLAQAERSGVRFWNFNACIIKPSLEQVSCALCHAHPCTHLHVCGCVTHVCGCDSPMLSCRVNLIPLVWPYPNNALVF